MNINLNTVNFNEICEGCLSVNRKLGVVIDNEIKEFYASILLPENPINHILALCWECTAIIKRTIKYKKQVQHARKTLLSFMLHQSLSLPSLSQLITQRNTPISIMLNPRGSSHNRVNTRQNKNSKGNNSNEVQSNAAEPVFIKVEEDATLNYCQELEEGNDFEGHSHFDEGGGFEGNEDHDPKPPLQPATKTDQAKHDEPKSKTKPKKSTKKKKTEFNESDDEPLKKIKEEEANTDVGKKTKEGRRPGRREGPAGVVDSARVARSLQDLGAASEYIQMVVLSWEEVEVERQRALTSETFTRHEYRCEHCVVGFNHRFKLDNHMAKHDPSAGELMCSVCTVRCPSQHALTAHRRRHRVRWRCARCGALWSRAGVAADHAARMHLAPTPKHRCAVCGHNARSLSKLRNHLKNHAERQKCDLCGKTFRDKSTLKTHLFIHKGEKEHACPHCGKMFLFKKAMQLHALTHDKHAHLYCHQCDMNFKNQMSFYQHMKYNLKHVDPAKLKYKCALCDKKFMKASRLQEHHTAVHLKLTPVLCPVDGCDFACSSRPVLRSHARMIHRNMRAVRNHVCHLCGKAYTNKKTLEGHLRSHSGERPFSCGECGAAFGHHAALYNHSRLVHQAKARQAQNASNGPQWTQSEPPPHAGMPS